VRGESSSAEKPWETTATAGVSFSSGNSENLVLSPGFLSTFRDDDDDAADPSYRITPGVHAGRSVILTDMGGLSLEGGLESTSARMARIESTKLSFSAAQRLDWQPGDHTYLTREIAYAGFVLPRSGSLPLRDSRLTPRSAPESPTASSRSTLIPVARGLECRRERRTSTTPQNPGLRGQTNLL
jgi:hypothetical protein